MVILSRSGVFCTSLSVVDVAAQSVLPPSQPSSQRPLPNPTLFEDRLRFTSSPFVFTKNSLIQDQSVSYAAKFHLVTAAHVRHISTPDTSGR